MNWLQYLIPWELQVAGLAILLLGIFLLAGRVLGWDRVKVWIAPALALLAAFGMISRNRQAGYNDRRAEEEKALDQAEDFADDKRHEVEALPDDALSKRTDRWTR
jgi:hypothetical protein